MLSITGSINLGTYRQTVDKTLEAKRKQDLPARIAARDHTVWKPEPHEIADRLGWLDCPYETIKSAGRISRLAETIRAEGFNHVVLLGMGGSSLAPGMFSKVLAAAEGYPEMLVIDTTNPADIIDLTGRIDPARTLFVVSTKSGTTIETISLFKYFYRLVAADMGKESAGSNFIAITDPQSPAVSLSEELRFRDIFLNDPDIGGRYSALSFFGMVPAALIGIDIITLLNHAQKTLERELRYREGFSALSVGIALAEMAKEGRDKATFVIPPGLESAGDWLEQLLAESTGKEGKGILPVVSEPLGAPDRYDGDRVFISLHCGNGQTEGDQLARLEENGHPVIRIKMHDPYSLGALCCFWELATAVAGHGMEINPFDQPDVESSKRYAAGIMEKHSQGVLTADPPALQDGRMAVFGNVSGNSGGEALLHFLEKERAGDYVAIQAYLPGSSAIDEALQKFRRCIRDRFLYATTLGYGPRYLHSTGQLHKGDAGRGLFIQLTADNPRDIDIPDTPQSSGACISFGTLKDSQAQGDYQALTKAGRRVMRIHLYPDIAESLDCLTKSLFPRS